MHLSDGHVHAGTALADSLGISRAAIWKHIQSLRAEGLSIEAVAAKGYRLGYPLDLLDRDKIFSQLNTQIRNSADLHILWQVTSTNDWLRQRMLQDLPSATICLAEQQTAGRGTRGREWFSPPGINVYLSLYWSFDKAASELGGLSLAVAISLVRVLTETGYAGLLLKWPNDIYTMQGKLGGILIDMIAETNGPTRVIIGIGLNFGMAHGHRSYVNQPIDDLSWQTDRPDMDRNQLTAMIINTLFDCCRIYQRNGFARFHQQWDQWDMVRGQAVILHMENKSIEGVACGVDETGALLLATGSKVSSYASGEVSLKETV